MNGNAPLLKTEAEMAESEISSLLQICMVASEIIAISWDFTCEICRSWSFKSFFQKLKKVTRRWDMSYVNISSGQDLSGFITNIKKIIKFFSSVETIF